MAVFIYGLKCPLAGVVRYIGKTKYPRKRLAAHISKARSQLDHHCARWIRSLIEQGLRPILQIIAELPDGADWQTIEMNAINEYRQAGCDLTNLTAGGDGFHDLPKDIVERRTESWRKTLSDPVRKAAFAEAIRKGRTPEAKANLSKSISEAWRNPVKRKRLLDGARNPIVLANRSKNSKRMHADPQYAARHSAKMVEIWNRPERKEEARLRSKKAWANAEITNKRIASIKAAFSTPQMKQKMSLIQSEINSRPEVKASKSAKMKAFLSDPIRNAQFHSKSSSSETRAKMSDSAKSRFQKPRAKDFLSTPERRQMLSESARRRSTPEYRAMMAEKTRQSWIKRKLK